jgi:hypothetical protein
MKERMTQLLLAVIAVLLLVQFFHGGSVAAIVQARGGGTEVIRARMIELVDDRGTVRANLRTEPDGEVVFRMADATGTIRVKLGASADGSGLVLLNERTEPGIHLLSQRTGTTVALAEKDKEKLVIKP